MRRVFDREQEMMIVSEYRRGDDMRKLAARRGCSVAAIHGVLRRAGAARPVGGKATFTAMAGARLRQRYEGGESLERLAREHGCGREAIRGAIRRAGGSFGPPGGRRLQWTDDQIAAMVAANRAGESQQKIAARLGVGQTAVSNVLRQAGEPRRWPRARDGRHVDRHGYVRVLVEVTDPLRGMAHTSGYVLEHRLVMARHLGRPLLRSETVHHINGDRGHNCLENLELRQGRHGSGQRLVCADCGSHNIAAAELK